MTRYWILISILIVIIVLLAVFYIKPNFDREDEVVDTDVAEAVAEAVADEADEADEADVAADDTADDTAGEIVNCSDLIMSTRKNCLIAQDGVAYQN